MHDPRPEWLPAGRVCGRENQTRNKHPHRHALTHTTSKRRSIQGCQGRKKHLHLHTHRQTAGSPRTWMHPQPGPGPLDPWTPFSPRLRSIAHRHPSTPLSALRRPLTWERRRDDAAAGVAPLGMDQEARARALSVPGTAVGGLVRGRGCFEAVVVPPVPRSPFPSVGRRKGKALAMARQHSSNRMVCRHREAVRPLPSPPTTSTPPFTTLFTADGHARAAGSPSSIPSVGR